MGRVAISACLVGRECRYDATSRLDEALLQHLEHMSIVPFCPEDRCFGTPRDTISLHKEQCGVVAIRDIDKKRVDEQIARYAQEFFKKERNISLFIGKDRSPSCAVCSAKIYGEDGNIVQNDGSGIMAKIAIKLGVEAVDAEDFMREML